MVGPRIDDTSIDTIFGTAMHEVIQDWLTEVFTKSDAYANNKDRTIIIRQKLMALFKENIVLNENSEPSYLCDKPTLLEYYNQGCLIMEYLQKYRKKIFPTKDIELVGIEVPLNLKLKNEVVFTGFIDIITKDTKTGEVVITDLKTSKSGWGDYQKKDITKLAQLLLYKRFYSQQYNVDEHLINVEFVILKRNITESTMYHIPRISKFVPAHGTPSVNKAVREIFKFIDECFHEDGTYKTDNIVATPSKSSCKFCPYLKLKDKCSVGIK